MLHATQQGRGLCQVVRGISRIARGERVQWLGGLSDRFGHWLRLNGMIHRNQSPRQDRIDWAYPPTSGITSAAKRCRRAMLSAMDLPRKSRISSCTPMAAKERMSLAMSSGLPEKLLRVPSRSGIALSYSGAL